MPIITTFYISPTRRGLVPSATMALFLASSCATRPARANHHQPPLGFTETNAAPTADNRHGGAGG